MSSVYLIGSPQSGARSSNGGIAITVPGGAKGCLVFAGGESVFSLDAPLLTGLHWGGGGMQFGSAVVSSNEFGSGGHATEGFFMLSSDASFPSPGAQTLTIAAAAYNAGIQLSVLFLGGFKMSSPIVDVGALSGVGNYTSALAGVGPGDLCFVAGAALFGTGADVNLNGQTVLLAPSTFNQSQVGVACKTAEANMEIQSVVAAVAIAFKAGPPGGGLLLAA